MMLLDSAAALFLVQGHESKRPVLRRETFYTVCIIIATSVESKKALRH